MEIYKLSVILSFVILSGCIFGVPFSTSLENGEAVPVDQVLVIGKMIVDPPLEQGNINVIAPRGTNKGVIKMNFAAEADKPFDKNDLFPFSVSQIVDFSFAGTSFLPMTHGIRYARVGTLMLDSRSSNLVTSSSGTAAFRGVDIKTLILYGDVKIEIPADAKAVYIGTIIYQHNIKNTPPDKYGYHTKKVSVKDEYSSAMKDLVKRKIPGIKPKDVVKKLAVVIREN